MPSAIFSTRKGAIKKAPQARKDDFPKQQLEKEASKQGSTTSCVEQVAKLVVASTGSIPPILRHIPRSRCKEGESPFGECTSRSIETKATKGDAARITSLKRIVIVPTVKMWQAKMSRPPIPRFLSLLRKAMTCQTSELKKDLIPTPISL